ncbi:E3 ubiquitin-protein ligase MBR2 isoform X1 [Capsicum annuum]|uniref:E3 ubiquitin-protein ligase MBR2 isoform X1 n=1 Tax=Capsicum annuum TaxID=4072 RepID=UPI001FB138D1|nr:E3 ubiquitin-protein ligase MBR2 isoform X1 [Capsicum annuum]
MAHMQGDRSILDSFPENIDLNQGSVSNNASMDPTTPWDSFLNPVENRLSNSMLSPAGRNPSYANGVNYNSQSFSGWDQGESSSTGNLHDCTRGSDLKIGQGWTSSSNDYVMTNSRSERRFEPSSVFSTSGYGGNHLIGRPPSVSSNLPSDHSLSVGYNNDDGQLVMRTSVPPFLYKSDRSEVERPPAFVTSDDSGTLTGSSGYLAGTSNISGSSMDNNWGSSCKRKAIEGNSGHSFAGGSSSSNAGPANIVEHNYSSSYNALSSLSIPPPAANMQNAGSLENTYPRNGVGSNMSASDVFPPLNAGGIAESSARNCGVIANLVNQDLITSGLPPIGSTIRQSSLSPANMPSGPASVTSSLDSGRPFSLPMNSGNPGSQSHMMHIPGLSRGFHSLRWDASPSSRGGSSSMISGDRYASLGDGANFSTIRNNGESHPFVPVPETRNMVLDPTNWSLATANANSSRNSPSSAVGPDSSAHNSSSAWTNQNSATTSHHRLPEFAPWILFPPVEPESVSQRGHFPLPSSAASPSEEPVMSSRYSSRGNRQPHLRSSLMVDPGEDVDGWRALAADVEGRHRLIRQVLNAMQRVENLRSEDYMLVDPLINGVAEFHDRHRGMRLDVDNMSYEELLALEERIGNVNTGLSEETILVNLKQRKHGSVRGRSSSNLEPCCICQEEYAAGDIMGMLDCGHEFHTNCIKQWLVLKNTCPICKMTALELERIT